MRMPSVGLWCIWVTATVVCVCAVWLWCVCVRCGCLVQIDCLFYFSVLCPLST